MSSLQGLILLESLLTSQSRSLSRFLSRSVSLCLSRSTLAPTWDRMSSKETLLMTTPLLFVCACPRSTVTRVESGDFVRTSALYRDPNAALGSYMNRVSAKNGCAGHQVGPVNCSCLATGDRPNRNRLCINCGGKQNDQSNYRPPSCVHLTLHPT